MCNPRVCVTDDGIVAILFDVIVNAILQSPFNGVASLVYHGSQRDMTCMDRAPIDRVVSEPACTVFKRIANCKQ